MIQPSSVMFDESLNRSFDYTNVIRPMASEKEIGDRNTDMNQIEAPSSLMGLLGIVNRYREKMEHSSIQSQLGGQLRDKEGIQGGCSLVYRAVIQSVGHWFQSWLLTVHISQCHPNIVTFNRHLDAMSFLFVFERQIQMFLGPLYKCILSFGRE